MVVLAAFGYAVGALTAKHRLERVEPVGMSAGVMLASAVALLPAAALDAPDAMPGVGPIAAVAVLGVLGTGFAFILLYHLISTVGPARAWLVTYIAPVFAVAYGALLLDEQITAATVAGTAMILIGSWLAAGGRIGAPMEAKPEGGGG